ncbi:MULTISPECIES: SDR family NAD(P)-dependent oxidoreductase [Ramlibacter]|uniref:SDR family oxidoreductase n=1 Tax=Ramlibacter pinisoli TaxID=2682844 RepID=A0A6N8IRZ6_9BURK|nr:MULTISPECIES: SDR family oxidoreductase [Ramlibacter]MBA2964024.1 SDR family oxidoreductase [Ramlibacter sp. CGMCC 1.13660]MVQ28990.1 SDR family oxidoreductase [Ramlibacter pinisoli]
MDLGLAGRHVLITGGSKGIGLACARQFAAEGAHVTLVARGQAGLDAALAVLPAAQPAHRAYATDVRDADAVARLVDRVYAEAGPVDVLVNCAGAARRTPFDELTPQAWHDAMQAKFFAYVHVIDPVIKRMGQAGRGAVVNVIGAGGKMASSIHLAGGSANAALMLASAGLAAAYGPRGVRVNAVNPGLTLTERLAEGLAADARQADASPADVLAQHTARIPLRRLADPQEIANAVVFLASDKASYITGAIVAMDGGVTPMVV